MTDNDEAAVLAQFNELVRQTPLHAHMDPKCLEHGPHTVVTMEVSDSVRGSARGSAHGGMLATLADAASAWTLSGAYEFGVEVPVTTDLHIRYYRQPHAAAADCRSQPGAPGPSIAELRVRRHRCREPSPRPLHGYVNDCSPGIAIHRPARDRQHT
jgi:acyl-coenzyme A thioesterase PaaI-like protein